MYISYSSGLSWHYAKTNRSINPSQNRQYNLWWRLEGYNITPINLSLFGVHTPVLVPTIYYKYIILKHPTNVKELFHSSTVSSSGVIFCPGKPIKDGIVVVDYNSRISIVAKLPNNGVFGPGRFVTPIYQVKRETVYHKEALPA